MTETSHGEEVVKNLMVLKSGFSNFSKGSSQRGCFATIRNKKSMSA